MVTPPEKMPGDRAYECKRVVCPACNAQPGSPCTTPTDTGRRSVHWFHFARESLADENITRRTLEAR